jgi:hypothetical protein
MRRFLIAIFAVWFAILLFPEKPRAGSGDLKEKVFLSRTCRDSKWYLDTSDDQSITAVCYSLPADEGN